MGPGSGARLRGWGFQVPRHAVYVALAGLG